MKEGLCLLSCVLLTLVSWGQIKGQDKITCSPRNCKPPDCYCATTRIPGDLMPEDTPQMVIFSFSGAIAVEEGDYIRDLFNKARRNPNGSPIRATLFVSDDEGETDYCTVSSLWADGHEVASFSVTRREPAYWWVTANQRAWEMEISKQREYIVDNTTTIPASGIVGFRSPHLQPGGDTQYKFALANNFTYDSSLVLPRKFNEKTERKLWPYTMDYQAEFSRTSCLAPPCPEGSFPGLWQIPFQPLTDSYGTQCRYLDSCITKPEDAEEVFDILMRSFDRSYTENRVPVMVNFLNFKDFFDKNSPWALDGVHRFIDEVLSYANDDVYFVTYSEVIEWMKTPMGLKTIKYFPAFHPEERDKQPCIEERPAKALFDGVTMLILELLACIIAYIVLYVKDKE